jgi:hypothetical protein
MPAAFQCSVARPFDTSRAEMFRLLGVPISGGRERAKLHSAKHAGADRCANGLRRNRRRTAVKSVLDCRVREDGMGAAGGGKRRFETYKPASVDWVGRPVMASRIETLRSIGMIVVVSGRRRA